MPNALGPYGLGRGFALDDLQAIEVRCELLPWTGCWIWMGDVSIEGYGRLTRKIQGRVHVLLLHRVTYAVSRGLDPLTLSPDHCVRHSCDTPCCVNPDHLELGTWPDNVRDSVDRGRHAVAFRQGRCANGHDLSVLGIVVERRGSRRCVACRRASANRYARRIRRAASEGVAA